MSHRIKKSRTNWAEILAVGFGGIDKLDGQARTENFIQRQMEFQLATLIVVFQADISVLILEGRS